MPGCVRHPVTEFYPLQVWFSNRRARLRKTAQSCSSPGYNPLALNMSGYSPASYMQGSVTSLMDSQDSGQLYSSAMQGLTSYASNIMGHTMNQYAAQSSLLSSQVIVIIINKIIYTIVTCRDFRYPRLTTIFLRATSVVAVVVTPLVVSTVCLPHRPPQL